MEALHGRATCWRVLCAALFVPILWSGGCEVAGREQVADSSTGAKNDRAVSQNQARLRMRSLVDPMCGQIEEAADAIMASTTDPKVQLAALNWKIDGVPAMREALYQPGWSTSVLDTLVLCNQMADYFETGAGKEAMGPASDQAVAACRRMEEEFVRVMESGTSTGDVSGLSEFARTWAAEHPIRRSIADRQSTLTRAFNDKIDDSMSAGEAIAEVTTTLDDLNRKLEVYSEQLFRQARWEAERFKRELLPELRADQAIPLAERAVASGEQALPLAQRAVASAEKAAMAVDRLMPAVERALQVAEQTPKMVSSERDAAIGALREEMVRTKQFIHEERTALANQLSTERGIILNDLNESIIKQREQVMLDVDQISLARIDYAMHLVTRLVICTVAVLALLALLGLYAARWILVRRPA